MAKIFAGILAVVIALLWMAAIALIPTVFIWLLWPYTGEYFHLPSLGFLRAWALLVVCSCLFKPISGK